MAKVEVNNTTYTVVLYGAGFCISDAEMYYAFGETTPTDDDSFILNPRSQVNSAVGKKLWAKAVSFSPASVTAVPV